jgi:hypothetical protein
MDSVKEIFNLLLYESGLLNCLLVSNYEKKNTFNLDVIL